MKRFCAFLMIRECYCMQFDCVCVRVKNLSVSLDFGRTCVHACMPALVLFSLWNTNTCIICTQQIQLMAVHTNTHGPSDL